MTAAVAFPEAWERRLVQLIAEVSTKRAEHIRADHRLREDLGMDSVCSLELISMLAEEFDINITVEEATQIHTVSAAMETARRHLQAQAAAQ